jgi:hypothetical protein
MVRRGRSSFERRNAFTYARGSVGRASGFVLTGNPEIVGAHCQFLVCRPYS